MAVKVLRGIASDIAESGYYSTMAEASTDVSNIEHLVICIHWVDKEVTACEECASCSDKCRYNCRLH